MSVIATSIKPRPHSSPAQSSRHSASLSFGIPCPIYLLLHRHTVQDSSHFPTSMFPLLLSIFSTKIERLLLKYIFIFSRFLIMQFPKFSPQNDQGTLRFLFDNRYSRPLVPRFPQFNSIPHLSLEQSILPCSLLHEDVYLILSSIFISLCNKPLLTSVNNNAITLHGSYGIIENGISPTCHHLLEQNSWREGCWHQVPKEGRRW